ncbi:MAG: PH domain-containing protein [Stenotrophomonas sp.]
MPTATSPHRDYPVATTTGRPLLLLWAILLLAAALSPALLFHRSGSAGLANPSAWLGPAIMLLTGAVLHLAFLRQRITLDGTQLDIRSTFYRKTISISALRMEQARLVDLAEHTELKPTFKTNGFGMPGFQSGHFRMRGGGKAFCLLTDRSRVLALPLRDGSMLLLSPEQPRALLDELKRLADIHAAA